MSQKSQAAMMYKLTMARSGKMICDKYGKSFWKDFKKFSNIEFQKLMSEFEDIGQSIQVLKRFRLFRMQRIIGYREVLKS